MTLAEILKGFKENETPENIVPLVEDAELRNALVAWKSVVVSYREPASCEDDSEAAMWNWMWDQVEFDLSSFAVVAGCQPQHAGRLFTRLKGLRMIYPDGTINTFAAKYLQAIIMSKLPKAPKAPKQPR
jgi:hypothetical protein